MGVDDLHPGAARRQSTGEPQAELWLGAHPLAPSLVGSKPLDQLVTGDPERTVGRRSVDRFGPRLPYLLKILAAAQPLSLQAHPSRQQAEEGYRREEAGRDSASRADRGSIATAGRSRRCCARWATRRFCVASATRPKATRCSRELGVESALRMMEPLQDGSEDQLEEVFSRILRLAGDERKVVAEVADAAKQVSGNGELAEFAGTALSWRRLFPADPGVLAALLMNRMSLHPERWRVPARRKPALLSARQRSGDHGQLRQRDARRAHLQAHRRGGAAHRSGLHPRSSRSGADRRGVTRGVGLSDTGSRVRVVAARSCWGFSGLPGPARVEPC